MNRADEVRGWPFPGVVWGEYPEQTPRPGARRYQRCLGLRALQRFADVAAAAGVISESALPARLMALAGLAGNADAWLLEATVLAASALAHTTGYAPHRQQLMAARVLLDDRLAEMATGEGKTAAIAIAAAVAALGRAPVHVVTANDYLAQRDAETLRPYFNRLQLSVGAVTHPMDAVQRRQAYGADVTYCTAKELAFDYLRDGLAHAADLSPLEQRARRLAGTKCPPPVLRGLCVAILDEADTVLIDEARVPLVLAHAQGSPAESVFYREALAMARRLAADDDYQPCGEGRRFQLTGRGRQRLAAWPIADDSLLGHRAHREAAVELALVALHVLNRDHDYVVRDGKVMLIDETTGRAAQGRAWSAGLHQLVEWKEGVPASHRNSTVTEITLQRFFSRYLRLAGASGTLAESRDELRQVYGLDLAVIPPRFPSRVKMAPLRLLPDSSALWEAVALQARTLASEGRPVLIGTETVAHSEALSAVLARHGLPHDVLNARQDQQESQLIALAGRAGRITVATSMAGRGTDIRCEPKVLERGGLHVILCQVNASARIDRQFLGRAGRQGQPGSVQRMIPADALVLQRWWPRAWLQALARNAIPEIVLKITLTIAQRRESFTHRYHRARLSHVAESVERDLTFSRQVQHEKA